MEVAKNQCKIQTCSTMEKIARSIICLEDLPLDIIYEILGRLPVEAVIRARRVSRRLFQATHQRSVWISVYERSPLLLPQGPLPSQRSYELEYLLVRAAKMQINWSSPQPLPFTHRRFPRSLHTYHFDANMISGRYLQLAERNGISWYDLDASDISRPILEYPCPTVIPMSAYLKYQVNANEEGPDAVWISFVSHTPSRIGILKANFGKTAPSVTLHAELPVIQNVTSIEMGSDWLLPVREFTSPDDPMDLFHIPSRTTVYISMHDKVQNLSDLSNLNFAITPGFLFLMLSTRKETFVDVYTLPKTMDPAPPSISRHFVRSYCGIYPHAISTVKFIETFLDQPEPASQSDPLSRMTRISFLALVYLNRSSTTWTSKIGLHVFDAIFDPHVKTSIDLTTQSETTLNVGIVTTSLSLSARSGICLAVTHSSPGPVILVHRIQRFQGTKCTLSVKNIKPPDGLQSREMVGWDGFSGRLCLINGWTNIDLLDYAQW